MSDEPTIPESTIPESTIPESAIPEPPSSALAAGPTEPQTPPALRLALLLARRGEVLLGRPGDVDASAAWSLPSGTFWPGETFVAAARRVAEGALPGVPLTLVNFQRLTLAPESTDAAPSVTVGLYAEVDPATEPSDATWLFFTPDALPEQLTLDAEAALRAFYAGAPIVDLDGEVMGLGYGRQLTRPAPQVPPASVLSNAELEPDFKNKRITQAFVLFSSAALLAGGGSWLMGVGVALDHTDFMRDHRSFQVLFNAACTLAIMVLALRKGARLGAASTRWRGIFRGLGSVVFGVAFGSCLVFLATRTPQNDDPHVAFWCWFFGLLTTALAMHLLRPRTEPRPFGLLRKLAWFGVTFISLVCVFPPLKDALFRRPVENEHPVDAPPPADD